MRKENSAEDTQMLKDTFNTDELERANVWPTMMYYLLNGFAIAITMFGAYLQYGGNHSMAVSFIIVVLVLVAHKMSTYKKDMVLIGNELYRRHNET